MRKASSRGQAFVKKIKRERGGKTYLLTYHKGSTRYGMRMKEVCFRPVCVDDSKKRTQGKHESQPSVVLLYH